MFMLNADLNQQVYPKLIDGECATCQVPDVVDTAENISTAGEAEVPGRPGI